MKLNTNIRVCVISHRVKKDGSFKMTIEGYLQNRNGMQNNFIKLPCNAIFASADYDDYEKRLILTQALKVYKKGGD